MLIYNWSEQWVSERKGTAVESVGVEEGER